MEKLISLDSGSDMLALQAFMVFAEMPSIYTIYHTNSSDVTTKLHETSACGCNNKKVIQQEL